MVRFALVRPVVRRQLKVCQLVVVVAALLVTLFALYLAVLQNRVVRVRVLLAVVVGKLARKRKA